MEFPQCIDHSKGDLVAITRGDPEKTTIGIVATKEPLNLGGIPKHLVQLKSASNPTITREIQVAVNANTGWTDERRDIFLCPVYSGPRLSMIARDNNEPSVHTYKVGNFRHVCLQNCLPTRLSDYVPT